MTRDSGTVQNPELETKSLSAASERNSWLDDFMQSFNYTALTYDDVSLVTRYADFLPAETDLTTLLTRNIPLNTPFVSAAMDTVTEADMAIEMALQGGIGIIHKNLDPMDQRSCIKRVKFYLNGFLVKARIMKPDTTIEQLHRITDEKGWSFHTFPIIDDDRRLQGMVTSREIKYCDEKSTRLDQVMISNPVSAPEGTTIREAFEIMSRNKISALPILDGGGIFKGMYCYKDVHDILKAMHPLYNRDANHKLRCGAAVGPETYERVEILMEAPLDVLVVDTAHGFSRGVIEMIKWIKKKFPAIDVIGGNVASGEAARALIDAGADGIKVGVGPGSICTTRIVTGVGVPQLSAVYECGLEARGSGVPIIADGGIRYSGDVAKALVAGASSVMMGSVLAGTDESPGERILVRGRQHVMYRGMGSVEAMAERFGSADRYGQSGVHQEKLVPEGIEGLVPYAGSVEQVLHQYVGGLRASLGYNGCRSIRELRIRGRFRRITPAGRQEAHPHDIQITHDAPNYNADEH
jgi:IMP dehydrogenase